MDDEFNVIAGDDEEVLHYPDDDEEREIETFVNETAGQNANALAELNGLDRRSGKRRFCEMIEDDPTISHPLDWHLRMPLTLEERESKRYRQLIEEEILDRMTHKIVEARSRKSGNHSNGKTVADDQTEQRVWGQILTMPPIDGSDWMGVSSDTNDQRFYVRLFNEGKAMKRLKKIEKRENLMYAFDNISKEVEELRKTIETRREEEEQFAEIQSVQRLESGNSALWVDKYAPKGFAELVSDDEINRNLLTWLKLWDECVFRRKLSELDQLVDENKKEIFCLDSGKIRRPANKILLLSGPAGLGKTTLAKIVARHAGYDTVEINGSDSRTVADFERVLEGAARSTRTISSNGRGRPNCLIIDEIDGAPADSVRHLIKAVQASGKKMLRRPIICICNNLFARSLRELRPIALSVLMTPPKEDRLVERFSQIACREEIRVDRNSLLSLVQLCSCDVRHALNALQYIAAATKQAHSCVTLKDIQEAVEAENLSSSSMFDGWSTILEFGRHLDNKRMLHNEARRIQTIQKYVAGEGNERFVTGLHSNYLRLSLPIKTLYRASDTFLFHDEINRVVSHSQNYTVMRYEIAFYALLHLIIATHHKVNLQFPKFEQDMVQRHRESQDTLATIRSQLSGRRTVEEMVQDLLPFIVSIVQPQIKPMNEQLYGKKDREIMRGAVTTMHSFGLTFAPTMVSTQVHFIFQPRIDVLTLFDLSDVSHRNACPNSIRQMIARHIELYRVQSEIREDSEKKQGNRAMLAVDNIRRANETSPVTLYFHFNGNVSAAVRKNVRLFNVFP